MTKSDKFSTTRSAVTEKVKEAAISVLPIVLIVTLLCLCLAPTKPELLLCFLIGQKRVKHQNIHLFEGFQAFYHHFSYHSRAEDSDLYLVDSGISSA